MPRRVSDRTTVDLGASEKDLKIMNNGRSHFHYRLEVTGKITKVPNNTNQTSEGVLEGFIQEQSPDKIRYTGTLKSLKRKKGPQMSEIKITPERARQELNGGSGEGGSNQGGGSGENGGVPAKTAGFLPPTIMGMNSGVAVVAGGLLTGAGLLYYVNQQ